MVWLGTLHLTQPFYFTKREIGSEETEFVHDSETQCGIFKHLILKVILHEAYKPPLQRWHTNEGNS